MKTIAISVIAFYLVSLTPHAFAQQGGKSRGEKALDTAVRILDILGGGGNAAVPAGGSPLPDAKVLAGQTQAFGGIYRGNGSQVTIQPFGYAATVEMSDARGRVNGLGYPMDGFFAAALSPQRLGGVAVYRLAGPRLNGTGVSYTADGRSVGLTAEVLEGSPNLGGVYRIVAATDASGKAYSGTCVIRLTGENNYHLTWTIGKTQIFGMGFQMGKNLWVAWNPTQDFYLTVFERAAGDPQTLLRHSLANNNSAPFDLPEVRYAAPAPGLQPGVAGGQAGLNNQGQIVMNRSVPGGGAPAVGNLPLAPVRKGGAQPQVDVPLARGGAPAIPAKGPQVNLAQAARELRADMDAKIAEFLKLHNDARAEVGVAPLQWDPKLAAYAQEWADRIGATGQMEHRPNGKYGENLAGYLPQYGERPVHGAKLWYDEMKAYRGQKIGDPGAEKCGHYTQMVWRDSTRVGFGMAMTKNGMVMLCANYDPPGNMIGEHPYPGGAVAGAALVGGGNGGVMPAAGAGAPPPGAGLEKPIGGAPAPETPVVAGIGLQLEKDWTNTRDGNVISSVSPDGTAGVFMKPVPSSDWDAVQAEMANHLASILPGLANLTEVSTEHDVFRDGVGLRVVTYSGVLNGANTRIVVDFARQGNVDDHGLLLIVRFGDEGADANWAKAQRVAESLRLKK